MPPSASLCSCSSGAVLVRSRGPANGLRGDSADAYALRPYALFSLWNAMGLRPPRAQAGRASLRCGTHQDPLALATPGLADGQGFLRGVSAEPPLREAVML